MRARWMIAGAVALLALSSGAAMAQGRGQGRGKGENRGQAKKAERQAEARFGDRDREVARNWYIHERRGGRDEGEGREAREGEGLPPGLRGRELPPGLRDRDRLPPGLERRLQPGYVIEPAMRPQLYPVPDLLLRQFTPPPPGNRYFSFGGHIVLVDNGYRLMDMISLNLNIGGR